MRASGDDDRTIRLRRQDIARPGAAGIPRIFHVHLDVRCAGFVAVMWVSIATSPFKSASVRVQVTVIVTFLSRLDRSGTQVSAKSRVVGFVAFDTVQLSPAPASRSWSCRASVARFAAPGSRRRLHPPRPWA